MLIVPELERVFVLIPRTGTGTLYRQLKEKYPSSILLYRHMEAVGCPKPYSAMYKLTTFIRHPLHRMWSLWKMLHTCPTWKKTIEGFENFEEWLEGYESTEFGKYGYDTGKRYPQLSVYYDIPETRKSQNYYIGVGSGVEVFEFAALQDKMQEWGLEPGVTHNSTEDKSPPWPSQKIMDHLEHYHKWDLNRGCQPL